MKKNIFSEAVESVKEGNNNILLYMIGLFVCIIAITFFVDGNKIDEFIGKPTTTLAPIVVPGGTPKAPVLHPTLHPTPTISPWTPTPRAVGVYRNPQSIHECNVIYASGKMTKQIEDVCSGVNRVAVEEAQTTRAAHEPTKRAQISAWSAAVSEESKQ